MKRLILAVAVLLLPSLATSGDFSVAELLQGFIDPHVVAAVGWNETTKKYSAILTANVVGPKLGTLPCYISGVGVSLGTVAPGLEGTPIAATSLPFVTCAPFGEQVAFQGGMSIPLNGPHVGNTYYFGVGISIGGGPAQLQSKRVKRIAAKKKAKQASLQAGPPAPVS